MRISGEDVRVRAQIRAIQSYSAHADQAELLDWIADRLPIAGSLFLDHGEGEAQETMRRELQRRHPGLEVRIPEIGEEYILPPGEPAMRSATGRMDLDAALGRDWQNEYAAFATSLKQNLARLESDRDREKALAQMQQVLDSYAAHKQRRARRERGT